MDCRVDVRESGHSLTQRVGRIFAKGAREMRLIGEARIESDHGERMFRGRDRHARLL